MTSIEWTDKTWNPIAGCSRISSGCDNCYAIRQAHRNAAIAKTLENPSRLNKYEGLTKKSDSNIDWTGKVTFDRSALEIPLKRKKPTKWFVNSMSDLFHPRVEGDWIEEIFAVMRSTLQHTYQILTKRPHYATGYDFPNNTWLGATIENQGAARARIPALADIFAPVRFLSVEPLLEEVDLKSINGIDSINWVIVGGESGAGARKCHIEWIERVVSDCRSLSIPVFVKQLGSNPCYTDTLIFPVRTEGKGNDWDDPYFPDDLKIREFPATR